VCFASKRQLDASNGENCKLNFEKDELKKALEIMKLNVDALTKKVREKDAEIEELKSLLRATKNENAAIKSELDDSKAKNSELQGRFCKLINQKIKHVILFILSS
jgi:predicted nuclease with TOPRIM domain